MIWGEKMRFGKLAEPLVEAPLCVYSHRKFTTVIVTALPVMLVMPILAAGIL